MKTLTTIFIAALVLSAPVKASDEKLCVGIKLLGGSLTALKQNGLSRETARLTTIDGKKTTKESIEILDAVLNYVYSRPDVTTTAEKRAQRINNSTVLYEVCKKSTK